MEIPWPIYPLFAAYVGWLLWRFRLKKERRAAAAILRETWPVALAFVFAIAALGAFLWTHPAAGATRWPAAEKLQRCMVELDKIKDPKLRRWCTYWSTRLP